MMKKYKLGRILSVVALLCGTVALLLYLTCGLNEYNNTYSTLEIVVLVAGILLSIVAVVFPVRLCMYGGYLCFLAAFVQYIVTQINYLAAVIYPLLVGTMVDDVAVSFGFVAILVLLVAAFVAALVAGNVTNSDRLDEIFLVSGTEDN